MKLEYKFVVPTPVEQAWAAFNDLERVVPCFPGATLTSYDGDEFTGTCKVKLGPVSLQYAGTGTFVELTRRTITRWSRPRARTAAATVRRPSGSPPASTPPVTQPPPSPSKPT